MDFSKLINRTVYAPMLRHFGTTNTVPKCPRHFGTGAEVSRGHFFAGAEVSTRHFGTSAEMSWVRSVLGPKCPYTAPATVGYLFLSMTHDLPWPLDVTQTVVYRPAEARDFTRSQQVQVYCCLVSYR